MQTNPISSLSKDRIHFPGLNGVRSIAALIVLFFHINHHVYLFGLQPIKYFVDREDMARLAVVLFLVLSGFLITYLLLVEKKAYGFIGLRKFYVRRILRIWPLYYLILIIALGIVFSGHSERGFNESLKIIGLYAIFVPNFAIINGLSLLTISALWSVGVEEQFYAFWPLLVGKSKNVYRSLCIFLIAYVCLKFIFRKVIFIWPIFFGLDVFSFDALAIGGIVAYLYFSSKQHMLKWLYHPAAQILSWLFFGVSVIIGPIQIISFLDKDIYATAFAIIILNVSTNPRPLIRLENKVFNFIGRISYGVYLYHMTLMYFLSLLLKPFIASLPGTILQFIVIYVITIFFTLLVSHFSYKYFELWFQQFKKRFTNVASSN